ncbi:hypothetical protein BDV19DRAFT_387162 [Aspergillus venezuelensis]
MYRIGADAVATVIDICLQFPTLDNFKEGLQAKSTVDEGLGNAQGIGDSHPFYKFAALHWLHLDVSFLRDENKHNARESTDYDAFDKALWLFGEKGQSHFKLWAITYCAGISSHTTITRGLSMSIIQGISNGEFSGLHMACALALPLLVAQLAAEAPKRLLTSNVVPTPFSCLVHWLPSILCCTWSDPSLHYRDELRPEIWLDSVIFVAERV